MAHSDILSSLTAAAAAVVKVASPAGTGPRLRKSRIAMPGPMVAETAPPTDYVALATGSLGGFPFYWQNPANARFNRLTYDWINSAVAGPPDPARIDGVFTNAFMTALSSIRYSLSVSDQQQMDKIAATAIAARLTFMNAWQALNGPNLDLDADAILGMIAGRWGNPGVSINDLYAAADPGAMLPNAPAHSQSVIAALTAYLKAQAASRSLLDRLSRRQQLAAVLASLRYPSSSNGGLLLDDGSYAPAYRIETPVTDILDGLARSDVCFQARIQSRACGDGCTQATLSDGTTTTGDPGEVIAVETKEGTEVAASALTAQPTPVEIAATFEGVTAVLFGPEPFDRATGRGWFWEDPIVEPLNGAPDGGGFSFSPRPPFDFSPAGRFGRLAGLLVARAPRLALRLDPKSARSIASAVNGDPDTTVTILDQKVSGPDTAETAEASIGSDPDSDRAILRITPAVSAPTLSSRAYVLGAIVRFPGAGPAS